MLKHLAVKYISQPSQSFKHHGVGDFQDRTPSFYHGFFLFLKTLGFSRALRERYARRTGVFVDPFRGTPFDLPVNLDEGRMLSSSLFDQGRQNP
jgi:hypothetical protein